MGAGWEDNCSSQGERLVDHGDFARPELRRRHRRPPCAETSSDPHRSVRLWRGQHQANPGGGQRGDRPGQGRGERIRVFCGQKAVQRPPGLGPSTAGRTGGGSRGRRTSIDQLGDPPDDEQRGSDGVGEGYRCGARIEGRGRQCVADLAKEQHPEAAGEGRPEAGPEECDSGQTDARNGECQKRPGQVDPGGLKRRGWWKGHTPQEHECSQDEADGDDHVGPTGRAPQPGPHGDGGGADAVEPLEGGGECWFRV